MVVVTWVCHFCLGHYTTYALVDKPREVSREGDEQCSQSTHCSSPVSSSSCNSSGGEEKEWMHFSDECVRPVTLAHVLRRQAYILFYDRVV